jgi:hypothetical protein
MYLKPLLSSLLLLLAGYTASADLALTLTPSVKSGVGTNEVVFAGILTNRNTTGNLFLNNIGVSFNSGGTNFAAETNVFFANVPGILLPGEAYNDVVFAVSLSPSTPSGNYSGTVTISGGTDIFGVNALASQTFQITLLLTLAISRSGANVVLSWPAGNYVLQKNADLQTTNWITVTNAPTLVNGQNQLVLPPSAGNGFFRLRVN